MAGTPRNRQLEGGLCTLKWEEQGTWAGPDSTCCGIKQYFLFSRESPVSCAELHAQFEGLK